MIHTLIYRNTGDAGYSFDGRNKSIPTRVLPAIQQFCESVTCNPAVSPEYRTHFRYLPLQTGGAAPLFLLSAIHRFPDGTEAMRRPHSVVVNYVMDSSSTDALFAGDLPQRLHALLPHGVSAPPATIVDWEPLLKEEAARHRVDKESLCTMLHAFQCAMDPGLRDQILIPLAKPETAVAFLWEGLRKLPPHLRKFTAFHTGAENGAETRGIPLVLTSQKAYEYMSRCSFDGRESSLLLKVYPHTVPEWDADIPVLAAMPEARVALLSRVSQPANTWTDFVSHLRLLQEACDYQAGRKRPPKYRGDTLTIFRQLVARLELQEPMPLPPHTADNTYAKVPPRTATAPERRRPPAPSFRALLGRVGPAFWQGIGAFALLVTALAVYCSMIGLRETGELIRVDVGTLRAIVRCGVGIILVFLAGYLTGKSRGRRD